MRLSAPTAKREKFREGVARSGPARASGIFTELDNAVSFLVVFQNQDVLGRGRAWNETPCLSAEETASGTWTLGCDSRVHSQPADVNPWLSLDRRAGKDASPSGLPFIAATCARRKRQETCARRTQSKLPGKSARLTLLRSQEEPIRIPFPNFETEWDANQGQRQAPSSTWAAPCPGLARRAPAPAPCPLNGIGVQLHGRPKHPSAGFDEEVSTSNKKPLGIERLSPQRGRADPARTGRSARHLPAETLPPSEWSRLRSDGRRTSRRRWLRLAQAPPRQGGLKPPRPGEARPNPTGQCACHGVGMLSAWKRAPAVQVLLMICAWVAPLARALQFAQ